MIILERTGLNVIRVEDFLSKVRESMTGSLLPKSCQLRCRELPITIAANESLVMP